MFIKSLFQILISEKESSVTFLPKAIIFDMPESYLVFNFKIKNDTLANQTQVSYEEKFEPKFFCKFILSYYTLFV